MNGPGKVYDSLVLSQKHEAGEASQKEIEKMNSLTNKEIVAALHHNNTIKKISKLPGIGNMIDKIDNACNVLSLQINVEALKDNCRYDLTDLQTISREINKGNNINISGLNEIERDVIDMSRELEMMINLKKVIEAAMNHNDTESTSRRYHNADNKETLTEDFQSYTIQSGDTLGKIASKYGISWQELYKKNRATIGNDPGKIMVGDRLIIPNNGSEQEQYEEQREREAESARTVSQKPREKAKEKVQPKQKKQNTKEPETEAGLVEQGKEYVKSRVERGKSWFSSDKPEEKKPEEKWSGEKVSIGEIDSLGVEYSEDRVTQCSKTARLNGRTFGVNLPRGHARNAVSKPPIDESFVKSLTPHDTFNAIENQLNSLHKKSGVNFCDVDVESNTENGKKYGHRVVMFKPDNMDYRYVLDPYKQNHLGGTKPKLAEDYFGSHKLYKINTYKADKRVIV